MTYQEAVAFVEGLAKIPKGDYLSPGKKDRSLYLKRLRFLLAEVGNPHLAIPNFIHVGGTSGKGTVTMTIAESIRASGRRTGAYTSPHITTTVERFWTQGRLMSPARYVELVLWITPALLFCLEKSPYGLPSYFEIELTMAFEHFRREKCEWVVLEVGCGGAFDATNVIPPPRAAVITNIGLDHMEILGHTKSAIAKTKAGIIKRGSTVFTSERNPQIRAILARRAKRVGAPFMYVPGGNGELSSRIIGLIGPIRSIGPIFLPGRFEILQKHPMVVLDVAHNPDKIGFLVKKWQEHKFAKPHILFGASANKQHTDMLRPLLSIARSITFVPFQASTRACANPHELARTAKRLRPSVRISVSLNANDTLDALLSKKTDEPILVTGSFFLAADIRKRWIPESAILKHRNPWGTPSAS